MWIFGIVLISLSGADGLTSFPDHLVVAAKGDPVTLTCRGHSDGNVTWKFAEDGKVENVEFGENVQQKGGKLVFGEAGDPMVGEYSCWSGVQNLSSVYLLLDAQEEEEDEEGEDLDSLISCRANSYDCNFNCNWTGSDYTAVRLGLGDECSTGEKRCEWVNGREAGPDGRFQFEMSHSVSPYAEESTMLEVTAEAISDSYYLKTTKRFYLRDIVQPDSPEIVRCQEVGQDLSVSIDPPASWSTPHSFFSLQHEIEYVYKDNGMHETSLSTLIPKRISQLRVRSRDPLVLSAWSQWSPWKNVTY
ncbi:interleukin-12 subunit beta [Genypterus blacodes]|uniref:interleukin-12 subunit beta n=1 Tax=Genypterus blacodes TaxID=154954 RepID=UPI003F7623FC